MLCLPLWLLSDSDNLPAKHHRTPFRWQNQARHRGIVPDTPFSRNAQPPTWDSCDGIKVSS